MVHSNERGRALEYRIAIEMKRLFQDEMKIETKSSETTNRLNFRDVVYFNELDDKTKIDFDKCAIAVGKWLKEQDWFDNADAITIDRLGDDNAKNTDPTDIKLGVLLKTGEFIEKNFSLKHHHDALCHPRLPSLPQQCGFAKGSKEDVSYRKKYSKIWEDFGKKVKEINPNIKTYSELDKINPVIKINYLYVPLMKNSVNFMKKCYNKKNRVVAFFYYLVGKTEYLVIKNEKENVIIKYFDNLKKPNKLNIKYSKNRKNHLLLEFNNGWKIDSRIHTASSRIFEKEKINKTEKMDPVCINIKNLLKIETIKK
jgi:hypothetical protein